VNLRDLDDDVRRDAERALAAARCPEPPVDVTYGPDSNPSRVWCAICGKRLNGYQASYGCPNGCTCVTMPACDDCGTMTDERGPCPICWKVFCQPCAEKPYEFCCETEDA
jgi:hypothetical protein